jgi:hypothetical protein
MSPVVEAAWIAAGVSIVSLAGTVTVAIVGFRNTRKATAQTVDASTNNTVRALAAARSDRLWDKQAAAYVDAVTEVLARGTRREALTSRGDVGNIGSHPRQERLKAEEPESIQIRAALRAYASEAVWAAYEAADEANTAFWLSLDRLASAQFDSERSAERLQAGASEDQAPPGSDYPRALDAMNESKSDAGVADDALFKAINRELAWNPSGTRT